MRKVAPDAEITDEAERMILKALAKDPEQRQQSMEEFHRDLQKCYGQLRFRRTLRTPTTMSAAGPQTAATIPLINKKKKKQQQQPPGAGSAAGEAESLNLGARVRPPTPPLPGLPLNARSPILLTKKKPHRPATVPPSERTAQGMGGTGHPGQGATPPATAAPESPEPPPLGPFDDTPLGANAITREIPKEGVGSTVYATPPMARCPWRRRERRQVMEMAGTASPRGRRVDGSARPCPWERIRFGRMHG